MGQHGTYYTCNGTSEPCKRNHARCQYCGWLLHDGEASTAHPRLCQRCADGASGPALLGALGAAVHGLALMYDKYEEGISVSNEDEDYGNSVKLSYDEENAIIGVLMDAFGEREDEHAARAALKEYEEASK
ncbi:hypothetical protein LCGC14_1332050 [marine sediment metagenome]|uniref:Uncharacterized protein n=1 Tax=marine sediment metagenome TaxID=412755 RepID=A0A0F9NIP3_9ZZZZ